MAKLPMLLIFLASLIYLAPTKTHAWSKQGHLTICDLAYRNLTEQSQSVLKELFQVEDGGIDVAGRGKMPDRFYTSFNIGCLEEDAIPRRHPDEHFINVDRNISSINSEVCPANKDCIFTGITRDLEILGDSSLSNEDRVFALMAIGHWIGDIHQPLHVSFKDDRGGNGIDVKLSGKCGSSKYRVKNLHAVWDNCILQAGMFERIRQSEDYDENWSENTITYRAVDALQASTNHAEELAIVVGQPWEWANDSLQITIDPKTKYCVQKGNSCQYSKSRLVLKRGEEKRKQKIGQSYLREFDQIAEEQVRLAGFRLAHLMNLAMDPDYDEPIRDSTQPP